MTKPINLEEINNILSDTIRKVLNKEMSLKQASMIAKLASTLSKNIVNTELKERVEFLEESLRRRK
ncbi:TPA: hypothetical protein DD445_02700 [Candidatus Nomurabacteria bacterium]|nr:hypothetical protein [Candidatus Nomurabacteria bacterium]HAS80793.1 hypothetical protein [Candidatus Nomurabacteria bacterium]HBP27672.1 hypothetical protein [Candidatus Nomurabacteria bacterium]HBR66071.1 hypothetical protein [Candidatus Nomurabacteria bacterium]HCU47352.1 hypothetical protein [Candidatus Nomurabacteria bacterium]